MSIEKSSEELHTHTESSILDLQKYLFDLIDSGDKKLMSKADKIDYWLSDWTKFLKYEPSFSSKSLKKYKHGEIIKVHLGFNIGSEEGGLHYAVVVEKNNPINSPVITIVPLTSIKPTTDVSRLGNGRINLGNELFICLSSKIHYINTNINNEVTRIANDLNQIKTDTSIDVSIKADMVKKLSEQLEDLNQSNILVQRMIQEINKMKLGSIALVSQITTISKIRIYDPKNSRDVLSNVKLSTEKLNQIDAEIVRLFTGKPIDSAVEK